VLAVDWAGASVADSAAVMVVELAVDSVNRLHRPLMVSMLAVALDQLAAALVAVSVAATAVGLAADSVHKFHRLPKV